MKIRKFEDGLAKLIEDFYEVNGYCVRVELNETMAINREISVKAVFSVKTIKDSRIHKHE